MNFRDVAKKVIWVALPLGLYSLIGVLLLPIYARVLTNSEMGVVELINVGVAIFQIICTFEIGQAMARFLPEAKNQPDALTVFNSSLFLTFIGSVVGAIGVYFISDWMLDLLGQDVENFPSFAVICTYLILIVLYRVFQLALIYSNHQRAAAQINFSYVLVLAGSTIIAYMFEQLNMFVIYGLQIFAYAVALIIGLWCCTRVGLKINIFKISKVEIIRQFSFSWPILGSSLAVFVLAYYDRMLLTWISSLADLGVFGVANRLSSAFVFALLALGAGLTPLIYSNYKDKQFMRIVELFFYTISAIIIISMTGAIFLGGPLVTLIATDKYNLAGRMLVPLIAVAFLSNSYRFFPGLDIAFKTSSIAMVNLFSCSVGLLLGYVLGNKWGVHGIIASKVIASASMAFLYLELGRRYVAPPKLSRVVVSFLAIFGLATI